MNVRLEKLIIALAALLAISGIIAHAQGDAGGAAPALKAAQEDEEQFLVG